MRSSDDVRLDHPVYAALTGPQARFAQTCGRVVRFAPDVAPFLAVPPDASDRDWVDAAQLVTPGTYVATQRVGARAPQHWTVVRELEVVQMVDHHAVHDIGDPEAVPLGAADVPEMLRLVHETDPGPFLARTVELGRFVGIRREGVLIAMAGERIHFEGWREVSAVCTAPAHRGQGLARRLVNAIIAGVHARDERAFLSVLTTNVTAIGLYERLGFTARRSRTLTVMTPEAVTRR